MVLTIPEAGHWKGPARVSRIALVSAGLKWHCPQRGVFVSGLPLEEGGRWHLHPGTHQVRM